MICEKYDTWSNGGVGAAIPAEALLATTSLYWFTGSIGASFAPYYARMHGVPLIPAGATIDAPAGHAVFPREIVRPPRSVAECIFTVLRRPSVMERGGHFAALEQPEALACDVADFFRGLR